MSLRKQVLLLAALTLLLPWAGYEYLGELARTLRAGQLDTLAARAQTVAQLIAREVPPPTLDSDPARALFAERLPARLSLDGYDDDWSTVPGAPRAFRFGDFKTTPVASSGQVAELSLRAAERAGQLYLFLRVLDDQRIYERTGEQQPNDQRLGIRAPHWLGDRLLLRLTLDGQRRDFLLATPAPGELHARYYGPRRDGQRPLLAEPRIRGSWQDTGDGYNLELALPWPADDQLGFAVIDTDVPDSDDATRWSGNADPAQAAEIGRLYRSDATLHAALQSLARDGLSLALFDASGWRLAAARAVESADESTTDSDEPGPLDELLERAAARLFVSLLDQPERLPPLPQAEGGRLTGAPFAAAHNAAPLAPMLYRNERRALLAQWLPLRGESGEIVGVLQASQPARAVDALAGRALLRLFAIGLLVIVGIVIALLGYASWLSWRVSRLRDAAALAVGPDGATSGEFAASRAGDEIGELSRDFAGLLGKVRDHGDYLRGLNGRLAHELRTPLAVVSSSLESLDADSLPADARRYRERAVEGSARLQKLIAALSEATRVEQAVAMVEREPLDLADFLRAATEAYRSAWPKQRFECELATESAVVSASPDLLAQLLDKLVANAVDFCAPGGVISLRLESGESGVSLVVRNPGPALPEAVLARVGEPMGSYRGGKPNSDRQAHLGLGLYIARLIAEAHGGRLKLENEPGGVVARVLFNSAQTR